LQASGIG